MFCTFFKYLFTGNLSNERCRAGSYLPLMTRKWTMVIPCTIINDSTQTGEKISRFRELKENRIPVLEGTLMVLYQTPVGHLTA